MKGRDDVGGALDQAAEYGRLQEAFESWLNRAVDAQAGGRDRAEVEAEGQALRESFRAFRERWIPGATSTATGASPARPAVARQTTLRG